VEDGRTRGQPDRFAGPDVAHLWRAILQGRVLVEVGLERLDLGYAALSEHKPSVA
jgi:hypothetical protein